MQFFKIQSMQFFKIQSMHISSMKFSNKALPFYVTAIASLSLVVIVCRVDLDYED